MAIAGSLLLSKELKIHSAFVYNSQYKGMTEKGQCRVSTGSLSSHPSLQELWNVHLLSSMRGPVGRLPSGCSALMCQSFLAPSGGNEILTLKTAVPVLTRSFKALHSSPLVLKLIPAVVIIAFAAWGLGPLIRFGRILFLHESDSNWKKSRSHLVLTSYLQPLLLWCGATLLCRALDPIILPSVTSEAVKQRLLNFVRSLSTVLAVAYCLSCLIQETQKFFVGTKETSDARTMGFEFAGRAVYSAVWIAAVSLFMELLGFSTQKWLTAGGLGTVLLTLAGREIFTNFLSSVMIHATRPFVLNEWIQTKIEGYEVSGTVEHVGWWSPTIIRGDDREAVHIPNHKFTVNVVRNLSQKTHWRIKTHLAISHLDVNKINNIVADMRKVLSKNPQVEQQRLHRRVFLDNVDSESQALLIMVSCFVKTSHFEEYLCVKEAVLLDLLRVISHHRARLATPIRTIQKIYGEPDIDNVTFPGTIFTRTRTAANRSFLLIEPGEEKTKSPTRPVSSNESADSNVDTKAGTTSAQENTNISSAASNSKSSKTGNVASVENNSEKQQTSEADKTEVPSGKQDSEKGGSSRPALEDNIVLGVALEGSKRVLPIDDEMVPSSNSESKELAAILNGNGSPTIAKDKKDESTSSGPGPTTPTEEGDQLR